MKFSEFVVYNLHAWCWRCSGYLAIDYNDAKRGGNEWFKLTCSTARIAIA